MTLISKNGGERFSGRRIYVTGAASGIGRALANLLAQDGAKVALIDVNAESLRDVASETGGTPIAVDLTDGAAIDASLPEAANALGGLDGVVNCAGISRPAGLVDLTPDSWGQVLAVNLTAPYRVCRAAAPYLLSETGSSIVNVASGTGIRPTAPGQCSYAASKGGLIALTRALALDFGPAVRVNTVCPGVTDTAMTAHTLKTEKAAAFIAQYLMNRPAEPIELARVIAFLISDEASFITGSTISADGGRIFY